jgi:hypothetical protein
MGVAEEFGTAGLLKEFLDTKVEKEGTVKARRSGNRVKWKSVLEVGEGADLNAAPNRIRSQSRRRSCHVEKTVGDLAGSSACFEALTVK